MSHPASHEDDGVPMLRPRPRRPFEFSMTSDSGPESPPAETTQSVSSLSALDGTSTPSRTRSILNLTSSTLFGIYSHTGYATDREEPSTPWGTGAETPVDNSRASVDLLKAGIPDLVVQNGKTRRRSTVTPRHAYQRPRKGFKGYLLPLVGRISALFGVGLLYGVLISHLHDRQQLAPVQVEGIDRSAWGYYVFWGLAGVALGQALPYADSFWALSEDEEIEDEENGTTRRGMVGWNDVVRSVGIFVGIAFAIRKLPWESTLQLSLTLALANPAIWYVIDRSAPGFIISSLVALSGTAVLLSVNPDLLPSPSPSQVLQGHLARHGSVSNATNSVLGNEEKMVLGIFSQESVGVATWLASVLFVSSVCFGNIGRRLAPQRP